MLYPSYGPNFYLFSEGAYHEPFLGGASVFLSIRPNGVSYLSDLNQELIDTYIALRDSPSQIIKVLSKYQNTESFYYKIRRYKPQNPINKAARFIYLNQTSFNGIYRVNTKGEYNIPFGRQF